MTSSKRDPRLFAIMLAAALGLVACGGGSTPSATAAPGGTTAPAATTDAGGGAESAPAGSTGGEINLGGAAVALDNLDNYSFKIEMKADGAAEFMMVPSGGSLSMEGAVQLKPTQAVDVTMTTSDGTTESVIGYRIIGDTAYINLGGDSWMAAPADDAQSSVDAFKPDQMLGSYGSLQGLEKVGDEDKNGIATEHYRSTADAGLGDMFGLPDATWVSDVWIAKDGGFVVSAMMVASGSADGKDGTFTISVDVTGANDPALTIEPPANVVEIPS